MCFLFQELEKNEALQPVEEETEEGVKKSAEGDAEEDEETVDEDDYDEAELEEVCIASGSANVAAINTLLVLIHEVTLHYSRLSCYFTG